MIMMIRRQISSLVFKRVKSSVSSSILEDSDFANRKKLVTTAHQKYYPLLSEIKSENTDTDEIRIPVFRKKYENYCFLDDAKVVEEAFQVNGKISSIRKSGKNLIFIDIVQDFEKLQIVGNSKMMGLDKQEFVENHDLLRRGDFISCIGYPGVTNAGELSLKLIRPIILCAPALHAIPTRLTDTAKINGNRVLDYLINKRSRDTLLARSIIISSIRNFLNKREFVEVETPIIASGSTGANATPFISSSVHLKDDDNIPLPLNLRVAPELWLKKLIISGFDKVFEIGKVFRNEGIDSTHNPEFTTCEFYQTFIGLEELIKMTEDLFNKIIQDLLNHENLCQNFDNALLQQLANIERFNRIEFIPTLEIETGLPLPLDLTTENLSQYFQILKITEPEIKSPAQYLDKLSSIYLEPLSNNNKPTIIYNQPALLSPLAKSTKLIYNGNREFIISRRFELFINSKEYVNSYEEENNPFTQFENFESQLKNSAKYKDTESLIPDYKFVENMELGMPPTGGWGLGIDRLVMLLTSSARIENVLSFGKLNDVLKQ
ncbi:hypothetical protein PACTADRAFT_33187 [Pachysolen tannophilus NRRL Y-2460]|uniref:Lysyl-tRNA synthetase n=1 Tax=Pachysolen tannophilus NRRL Y-2460 TaxID=669874 RepID=A0A1E4TW56_PACTA|nr:hypothetical protein PACTADRAFT_33187 [Pachysolen tannophilus NRRL Y-2460]